MKELDWFSSVIQSISSILWFRNAGILRKLWKDQEETGKSWEMTQIFKSWRYFPEPCFLDFHVHMNHWELVNMQVVVQGAWGGAHESVFLQSFQMMLMVPLCRQHFIIFFYQFHLKSVFIWENQRHSLSILFSCLLFQNFLPIAENLLNLKLALRNNILPVRTRTGGGINSVMPTAYKLYMGRTFWKGMVSVLDLCKINYHIL